MNDTIPPVARKIVDWLDSGDVQRYCSRQEKISEVQHLIASHVPIDTMVRERTAYRDLLRQIYAAIDHPYPRGRIEAVFAEMGETVVDPVFAS